MWGIRHTRVAGNRLSKCHKKKMSPLRSAAMKTHSGVSSRSTAMRSHEFHPLQITRMPNKIDTCERSKTREKWDWISNCRREELTGEVGREKEEGTWIGRHVPRWCT